MYAVEAGFPKTDMRYPKNALAEPANSWHCWLANVGTSNAEDAVSQDGTGSTSLMPSESADTDTKSFGPVSPQERVALLDVLRGFAILGIMFVNNDVAGYYTGLLFPSGLEQFGHKLISVLGSGKLWTLFAILYGVGFAIQLERADARGTNIIPAYLRRQFFLALIGCVLLLVIHVPQLLNLAVYGVPMLLIGFLLRRRPPFWLLVAASALLALNMSTVIPRNFERDRGLTGTPDVVLEEVATRIEGVRVDYAESAEQDASWSLDRFGPRVRGLLQWYAGLPGYVVRSWKNPSYVIYMLVGIFLWRIGVLREATKHRRLFVILLAVTLPLGLSAALYYNAVWHSWRMAEFGLGAYPTPLTRFFYSPIQFIASLCMPLAYIAGIALLVQHRVWSRWLSVLVPVGRTALSNYALQALLPALVFGQYTPGISKVTLGVWLTIAVLVPLAGLQVVVSRVWLRSYLFGPLEWLWRSLTYWQLQPIRRTALPKSA